MYEQQCLVPSAREVECRRRIRKNLSILHIYCSILSMSESAEVKLMIGTADYFIQVSRDAPYVMPPFLISSEIYVSRAVQCVHRVSSQVQNVFLYFRPVRLLGEIDTCRTFKQLFFNHMSLLDYNTRNNNPCNKDKA